MLWVDKHRPRSLKDLSYHENVNKRLVRLAENGSNLPHLLFYGPSGGGKKTRIMALLKEIYGVGVERLRLDKRTFKTPTKRDVDIHMICSNYHVELNPGSVGLDDRFVIQDVIKEMASNKSITSTTTTSTTASTASTTTNNIKYKMVVLVEVDQLSRQAQAALRRTMERYAATCRLILCCTNLAKVMEPLQSRCLPIRIPAPSTNQITDGLKLIAHKEHIVLSNPIATQLAQQSNRNMRRAILMMECTNTTTSNTTSTDSDQLKFKTDWELYIAQLAIEITREQSPQRLLAAREKLYELLINCIPPTLILKTLTHELFKNLDDSLKHEVLEAAAFYEHRIALGSKDIFHLEAFIAKYMALYKRYLNDMFA